MESTPPKKMATFTYQQQQPAPQYQSFRSPPYRTTPHHVTPSPSSTSTSTSLSYRFPVPNYVYGLEHLKIRATAGCTCKKSRCLKLYCQCFSNSSTCGPNCKCSDCKNTPANGPDIDAARRSIIHRNPGAFDTRPRWSPGVRSETEEYRQPPPGTAMAAAESSFSRGSPGVRQGYSDEQRRMPSPRAVVMHRSIVGRPRPSAQPHFAPHHPLPQGEHFRRGPRLIIESRQPLPTPRVYSVRTPPPPPPHAAPPPPPPKVVAASPVPKPEPSKDSITKDSPDRMAMMAAIAMTELGRKRPLEESTSVPTQASTPPRKLPKSAALSALPRALSFRKICSHCGRTRADHGDMGFGHRCRFTDCAKCGVQADKHVGPMGVTCPVVDTPQAKRYAQHLGDLAAAADLQRSLKQQRSTSV